MRVAGCGNFNQGLFSMRYTVILEQESDGGYVATVPALPGCVSQGDTRDEVMKYIREAADLSRRENKQRRVCVGASAQQRSWSALEWTGSPMVGT